VLGTQKSGTYYAIQDGVYLGDRYGGTGNPVYGQKLNTHEVSMNVTTIGIKLDYAGFGKHGTARLDVVLQTADAGNGVNTESGQTAWTYPPGTPTISDFSIRSGKPADYFALDVIGGSGQGPEIKPDQWHHVLVSWDLGISNSCHGNGGGNIASFVDSYSKMWCAIDGVDQSGSQLPSNWIGTRDGSGDPNGICTSWTLQYAGGRSGSSYSIYFSTGIQADGIFIPAEPEYTRYFNQEQGFGGGSEPVRPIYRVEMAELYIWSGLVLTSDKASKFINSTGGPMPPESLPFDQPTIRIHGTQAWLKGNNSGHLAGDFSRVGTIVAFKPDPQIGT